MRLIGLDVGEKRIGIAKVDTSVRIAIPYGTILVDGSELEELEKIARLYKSTFFIVGLPRNSAGVETAQSLKSREFAARLKKHIKDSKIRFQDESLTSVEAEKRLKLRGKPYQKADIDAEAATIILQDLVDSFFQRYADRPSRETLDESPLESQKNSPKTSPKASSDVSGSHHQTTPAPDKISQALDSLNYNQINDNLFPEINPDEPNAEPTQLNRATILAKISHITGKIPTPQYLLISLQEKQIPSKISAGIKKIPHLFSQKNFSSNFHKPTTSASENATSAPTQSAKRKPHKPHKKLSRPKLIFVSIIAFALLTLGGGLFWYHLNLSALTTRISCDNGSPVCNKVNFKITPGDSASIIAKHLAEQKIIRSDLAFQIFLRLNKQTSNIKAGVHRLNSGMSVSEITTALSEATNQDLFSFTIIPGDNIFTIQKKLQEQGYGELEIKAAFDKKYNHYILRGKPDEVSLEGYLAPDTYDFFSDDSVETIINRALDQTAKNIQADNLEEGFKNQGLSLHQGLTLASIIEKETNLDYETVAQIFLKRLRQNEPLGSDVTVSYALDLLDPKREQYTNNEEKLKIESPYNTRKNPGLPPSPIAAIGKKALFAVAHPAETDFSYFLTGDDGKMYYGKTSADHEYNIRQFCQKLCAVGL